MSVFLYCLLALAIYMASATPAISNTRIYNGDSISIDKAPYIVQLRELSGAFFCGGTLVSPKHVVTAAHCFARTTPAKAVVVGGVTTTFSDVGAKRSIRKVTYHPDYSSTSMHSDIAVIELTQEMSGRNIAAVPLCRAPVPTGQLLQVSGWGATEKANQSTQLLTAKIPVRDFAVCQREFGPFVQKNMFCASGLEAIGSCQGDSGGPAMYRGELCGVNAFGYKCGTPGSTDAFTDVFAVRSFIQNAMRG